MEGITMGTGLAAMGFWLFIAAVVAAGVWDSIRKRDAKHETLRRMIESGQPIDEEMANRVLSISSETKDTEQDLRVAGWICLALAPGLAIFGWVMGMGLAVELTYILAGVGVLMLFISGGLFIGAASIRRANESKDRV